MVPPLSSPLDRTPLALILLALLGAPACGDDEPASDDDDSAAAGEGEEDEAAPVRVVPVERGPIFESIAASATVDSDRRADILVEVSGTVASIAVQEGDAVAPGQELARLKNPQLEGELRQAETSLRRSEEDYEAVRGLFEKGFVSRSEYDQAALAFDTARLRAEQARETASSRELASPIRGTVSLRDLRYGEAVSVGRLAFQIVDLDALKVEVNLPEKALARVHVGQEVQVRSEILGGVASAGRVARLSPVVDPASGTVKVTVALSGAQQALRPGMFVNLDIVVDRREDALIVPKRALVYEGGDAFVFVVADGEAKQRPVTPGFGEEERMQLQDGVQEGEQVVIVGQALLRDGARVRILDTEGASHEPPTGG